MAMRWVIKTSVICFLCLAGCGGATDEPSNISGIEPVEEGKEGNAKHWDKFMNCNFEKSFLTEEQAEFLIQPLEIVFDDVVFCGGSIKAKACLPDPTTIHYYNKFLEPIATLQEDLALRFHEYWHSVLWQLTGDGDSDHDDVSWDENSCLDPANDFYMIS